MAYSNGQRTTDSGQRKQAEYTGKKANSNIHHGQRTTDSGQRKQAEYTGEMAYSNGQRTADNGQRTTKTS